MNISYNWLKDYINIDLPAEEVSVILTDIGLEVGGLEEKQSVKGGLEGLVIGEVKEKSAHPNADKLSLTKVDVGGEELLSIVCGAPNVEAGQKVVVATIGTTLYSGDESFQIKKSKIRGELSEGMLCGEDEIGLGKNHDGIMVLDGSVPAGTLAKDHFKVETETLIEIDITPNRADALSHFGVARDLYAYFKSIGKTLDLKFPEAELQASNNALEIEVDVQDSESCPRYTGVCINNIKVEDSPEWLQSKLKSIGLNPINNVVDVTNFVLHELGQPLHAFEYNSVNGKVVVKKGLNQKFKTLDEAEQELVAEDLMICNASEPMCVAGVMGGLESGTTASTTSIFLECAYFNPVSVRKTSKRMGLKTDSSFRFERGVDIDMTLKALKRAASLICEIAGGEIASEIVDVYPNKVAPFDVQFSYQKCHDILGQNISEEKIDTILEALEIEIVNKDGDLLQLKVPTYRVDVEREIDVIEDILRIHGYNNIEIPKKVNASLEFQDGIPSEKIKHTISLELAAMGFNEILVNSMTNKEYYTGLEEFQEENFVEVLNPLSRELMILRRSMLFGGLESISRNINHKNSDLKFFEFGKTYWKKDGAYHEDKHLTIMLTGRREPEGWNSSKEKVSFYSLKGAIEHLMNRIGVGKIKMKAVSNPLFSDSIAVFSGKKKIGEIAAVDQKVLKTAGIKQPVYYADLIWDNIVSQVNNSEIKFTELPKFPEVRRDLSLLMDDNITFKDLSNSAFEVEKHLLKEVNLFDVYEGDKLAKGKKSYALSFILQDENKTLVDKQIDKVVDKLIKTYSTKFGAEIR